MRSHHQTRVAFIDDDHVLDLIHDLVQPDRGGVRANQKERLVRFVYPEELDPTLTLAHLTHGLVGRPGLQVARATGLDAVAALDPHVVVTRRAPVGADLIEHCPNLRLIQRLGRSPTGIDIHAAALHHIDVSCLNRPSLISVAEHVLLLMLALSRQVIASDAAVRDGTRSPEVRTDEDGSCWNWAGITGVVPMHGKTLGIIGMGEVGTLVSERAAAFGMKVRYVDRDDTDHLAPNAVRPTGGLHELLAASDYVSLHVPGPPGTAPIMDAAAFEHVKPGAFLVNTSRGRLVDETALRRAIIDGRLGGAALDVHATEPRPLDDPLIALSNVILTPHMAGGTRSTVIQEADRLCANIRAAIDGHRPAHDLLNISRSDPQHVDGPKEPAHG